MKHKFTTREMILILICFVLAFGIFYYEAIYKTVQNDIASHNTDELSNELTVQEAKAAQYQKMKKEVAKGNTSAGKVAVYNNLAGEVQELGSILNDNAQDISIQWSDPVLDSNSKTTVRRQAAVSFDTTSYGTAKNLVQRMIDCRYRNVVTDLEISSQTDDPMESSNDVNVTLTITFFETTEGSTSQEGLKSSDDDNSTDSTSSSDNSNS